MSRPVMLTKKTSDIDFHLFPTLVIKRKQFLTRKQAQDIFEYIMSRRNLLTSHASLTNGLSSHSRSYCVVRELAKNVKTCRQIYSEICSLIGEYQERTGIQQEGQFDDLISNSWFNIQSKNSVLQEHTHPLSLVSGALYINADEKSSPLCFFNPVSLLKCMPHERFTDYNAQWYKIVVETGDLILFPSYLSHGSANHVNQTENRMVISFNSH